MSENKDLLNCDPSIFLKIKATIKKENKNERVK
jgi:hypothetical protein